MLSNKVLLKSILVFVIIFLVVSCSEKENKIPVINYQDKTQLTEIVKRHFDENVSIVLGGIFDETGKQTIAVGQEIENSNDWGIKFIQLEMINNDLKIKYETELLDGSFKESFIDKIKFSSFDHELIYYNSKGYYLGSGGGEVYSYIVNFEAKQVYYAHLVIDPSSSVSLFISENTQSKELRNFFTLTFKKDYPNLKVVEDDIIID